MDLKKILKNFFELVLKESESNIYIYFQHTSIYHIISLFTSHTINSISSPFRKENIQKLPSDTPHTNYYFDRHGPNVFIRILLLVRNNNAHTYIVINRNFWLFSDCVFPPPPLSKIMNTNVRCVIFLFLLGMGAVRGCSTLPPCGIVPQDIQLTTVPGILHVRLVKYRDCGSFSDDHYYDDYDYNDDIETIEVNVGSGSVRYADDDLPWNATGLGINGLDDDLPWDTTGFGNNGHDDESPKYTLKFRKKNRKIVVKNLYTPARMAKKNARNANNITMAEPVPVFGPLIFGPLPGFEAPPKSNDRSAASRQHLFGQAQGVISFFSPTRDRIYFVYPLEEAAGDWYWEPTKYRIASCDTTTKMGGRCDISEAPEDVHFGSIDTSAPSQTYDVDVGTGWSSTAARSGLVALPVPCCLCYRERFYAFGGGTITKSVSILNGATGNRALDTRTGVAHAAHAVRREGQDGDGININSESLSGGGETAEIYIDQETLAKAFRAE